MEFVLGAFVFLLGVIIGAAIVLATLNRSEEDD
jgi:hypothetical protein